jgi:magnesium chelatase family protein
MAKQQGLSHMVVAQENQKEAALIEGLKIYGISHLSQLPQLLDSPQSFACQMDAQLIVQEALKKQQQLYTVDFQNIQGQRMAKRALEIAAAGGHNVAFFGPPGSGKSLMAKAFASILPPMDFEEMLEVSRIYSISGQLQQHDLPLMIQRPFRSPHHSASMAGLVGGGNPPKPGEITLAHRGVLFLDEFTEFSRPVLEVLRQPLEDQVVTVSRAQLAVTFPANFILLVAMNPCPCGFLGDSQKNCICTPHLVQRYLGKLSGPLMDRMDMEIEVPRLPDKELIQKNKKSDGESSAVIQKRVIAARQIQQQRFLQAGLNIRLNSEMSGDALRKYCQLDEPSEQLMADAIRRFQLSGRAFDRLLKLSRTIADLEQSKLIQSYHLAEALQYRCYEKLMQSQQQGGLHNHYLAKTA